MHASEGPKNTPKNTHILPDPYPLTHAFQFFPYLPPLISNFELPIFVWIGAAIFNHRHTFDFFPLCNPLFHSLCSKPLLARSFYHNQQAMATEIAMLFHPRRELDR